MLIGNRIISFPFIFSKPYKPIEPLIPGSPFIPGSPSMLSPFMPVGPFGPVGPGIPILKRQELYQIDKKSILWYNMIVLEHFLIQASQFLIA